MHFFFLSSCFVFSSLQVTINTLFLYEDRNGNDVDENDGPESIYIVDQNEFIVEAIATHTDYLKNATFDESSLTCPMSVEDSKDEDIRMKEAKPKKNYVRYTVQDKVRFFDLKIEKCRMPLNLLNVSVSVLIKKEKQRHDKRP